MEVDDPDIGVLKCEALDVLCRSEFRDGVGVVGGDVDLDGGCGSVDDGGAVTGRECIFVSVFVFGGWSWSMWEERPDCVEGSDGVDVEGGEEGGYVGGGEGSGGGGDPRIGDEGVDWGFD